MEIKILTKTYSAVAILHELYINGIYITKSEVKSILEKIAESFYYAMNNNLENFQITYESLDLR